MAVDHCELLSELHQKLVAMHQALESGAEKQMLEIAKTTNWFVLADEFEPVVGRYKSEVRRHAQRLIRILRRPYILYHDCVQVRHHRDMLVGAIKGSPSLRNVADQQIADAWERDVRRDLLKGRQSREMKPVLTLADLFLAAKVKIDLGIKLDWEHKGFQNCQRVSYSELGLA